MPSPAAATEGPYSPQALKQAFTELCARLARAFTPEDFTAVFADPQQLTLFAPDLAAIRPVLTVLPEVLTAFHDFEVIIFGALIARVLTIWAHDPEAHRLLTEPLSSLLLVSVNTFLLLVSSLAVVLGGGEGRAP